MIKVKFLQLPLDLDCWTTSSHTKPHNTIWLLATLSLLSFHYSFYPWRDDNATFSLPLLRCYNFLYWWLDSDGTCLRNVIKSYQHSFSCIYSKLSIIILTKNTLYCLLLNTSTRVWNIKWSSLGGRKTLVHLLHQRSQIVREGKIDEIWMKHFTLFFRFLI